MSERRGEDLACSRCKRPFDAPELDRMLWCGRCVEQVQEQAVRAGWILGSILAGALAVWIWTVKQPSDLVIGGWIATVVAAFYFGARVARETVFGVLRFKDRPR